VTGVSVNDQFANGGGAIAQPVPAGPIGGGKFVNGGAAVPAFQAVQARDTFWPRAAVAWLVLSFILILLSVNLVSPTRRWHRPRLRGRSGNRAAAAVVSEATPEQPPASGRRVPPDGDDA
jgi:hypothetical protein